ncbi:MAG: putative metal-dependent hydrolase [Bacteroidota bacterium]
MKKDDPSRYPVGKHEYGKSYSFEETRRNIKTIAALPRDLKKFLKKLSSDGLNKSYRKGGWTVRQIVHHIADSHINAYIRMKMAVTEIDPTIKPYEEALWAETDDAKYAPVKVSLKLISALTRRWVLFLESLSDEDLERGYFHPALQQRVPLPDAIAAYAWHSRHHLAHIAMVLSGKQFEPENDTKSKKIKQKFDEKEDLGILAIDGIVAEAPKKRGPKPKVKPEIALEEVATEPKKRGPKPKAKPEITNSTEEEPKKRRGMSPEHMAKIRAARVAKRAAAGLPTASTSAPATSASAEPKKRGPKPKVKPEVALDIVAAEPKKRGPKPKVKPEVTGNEEPKKRRGMSPEHMAKIRAARVAKRAAAGLSTATSSEPKVPTEPKKRGPKPKAKPEVALDAVAAEPKKRGPKPKAKPEVTGSEEPKKRRGMSPEHMANIRAARVAKRAAAGLTTATSSEPKVPTEPKKRGPKPKAKPEVTGSEEPKKRRGMSPEHMAKIRAARVAKRAAAGLPTKTKTPPVSE